MVKSVIAAGVAIHIVRRKRHLGMVFAVKSARRLFTGLAKGT